MERIPKPQSPAPSPKPIGAPRPSDRAGHRGKPLAESDAELAVPADSAPRGATLAAIKNAHAQAAKNVDQGPGIGLGLGFIRETQLRQSDAAGERVRELRKKSYYSAHDTLERDNFVGFGEAMQTGLSGAIASTAAATPMAVASEGIGKVANARYEAAMTVMLEAGMARSEAIGNPHMDLRAVEKESKTTGDAVASSVVTPQLPATMASAAPIGPILKTVSGAARGLTAAALGHRANMADKEAAALGNQTTDGPMATIEAVISFASDALATVLDPTALGVAGLAISVFKGIADFLGSGESKALQERVADLGREAKDARETAGWEALAAGIDNLTAASQMVMVRINDLDHETQDVTSKLAMAGGEADKAAIDAGRLPEGREQSAAMAQHVGKLLEAHRFNATARDAAQATVVPVKEAGRAARGICAPQQCDDLGLDEVREHIAATGEQLYDVERSAIQVQKTFQERLWRLGPAVTLAVQELGRFSEHPAEVAK